MPLKEMQIQVDEWVSQYKIGYYPPLAIITQLCEEIGELAREVNNRHGPRVKKSPEDTADIGDEIADAIFTLICLANRENLDLDKHFKKRMDKCYGRDRNRWERK